MKTNLVIIGAIKTGTSQSLVASALRRGLQVTIVTAHNDPLHGIFPGEVGIVESDLDPQVLADRLRSLAAFQAGRLVLTTTNNRYARIAAKVAEALGLPGPDAQSIDLAVSKQAQKRVLQGAGIATPAHVATSFSTLPDDAGEIRALRWPVVVKPEEGSESFGVRLCTDFDEVVRHAQGLRQQLEQRPRTGLFDRLVVEEYLSGPEFCVELFDGTFAGALRKLKRDGKAFIERGYTAELDLEPDMLARLAKTVERAGSASGLTWGPAHFDCIVHQGIPHVIEMNARIAGSFISTLVADAYGFDLVEALLDKLLGLPVSVPAVGLPASYARVDFLLDGDPGGWNFTTTGQCENDDVVIRYGPQVVDHRERRAYLYVRAKRGVRRAPEASGAREPLERTCAAN
jgi:predicted ATP-grasp superfamily ATP-dependent carboligase